MAYTFSQLNDTLKEMEAKAAEEVVTVNGKTVLKEDELNYRNIRSFLDFSEEHKDIIADFKRKAELANADVNEFLDRVDFEEKPLTSEEAYQKGLEEGKALREKEEQKKIKAEETKKAEEQKELEKKYLSDGLISLINKQFYNDYNFTPFEEETLQFFKDGFKADSESQKYMVEDILSWASKKEQVSEVINPVLNEEPTFEPILTEKEEPLFVEPVKEVEPIIAPVISEIPKVEQEQVVESNNDVFGIETLDNEPTVEKEGPKHLSGNQSEILDAVDNVKAAVSKFRKVVSQRNYTWPNPILSKVQRVKAMYVLDSQEENEIGSQYNNLILQVGDFRLNHATRSIDDLNMSLANIDKGIATSSIGITDKKRLYKKLSNLARITDSQNKKQIASYAQPVAQAVR